MKLLDMLDKRKRLLKKLKKYVKREWKVNIDIDENEKIIQLAEKVVMISENCSKKEAYQKWILREDLHLPGWVSVYIIQEFVDKGITANNTIGEMIDVVL